MQSSESESQSSGPRLQASGQPKLALVHDITFCDRHKESIRVALVDRGFVADTILSAEQRQMLRAEGKSDIVTDIFMNLATLCTSHVGGDVVAAHGGCPCCAYENMVGIVADVLAAKRRAN